MNELNYATFEASQRLLDAGIVLATENYWRIYGVDEDPVIELVTAEHRLDGWDRCNTTTYPAPSMAEVWRELILYGFSPCSDGDNFWICDGNADEISPEMSDPNPTDALIDLLIWVTEQKGKEKP